MQRPRDEQRRRALVCRLRRGGGRLEAHHRVQHAGRRRVAQASRGHSQLQQVHSSHTPRLTLRELTSYVHPFLMVSVCLRLRRSVYDGGEPCENCPLIMFPTCAVEQCLVRAWTLSAHPSSSHCLVPRASCPPRGLIAHEAYACDYTPPGRAGQHLRAGGGVVRCGRGVSGCHRRYRGRSRCGRWLVHRLHDSSAPQKPGENATTAAPPPAADVRTAASHAVRAAASHAVRAAAAHAVRAAAAHAVRAAAAAAAARVRQRACSAWPSLTLLGAFS